MFYLRFFFIISGILLLVACNNSEDVSTTSDAQATLAKANTSEPTPTTAAASEINTPELTATMVATLESNTPQPTPTVSATSAPIAVEVESDLEHFLTSASFVVHFSTPMDSESVLRPLNTSPSVAGTYEWSEDGTVLTFTPTTGFSVDEFYRITLNNKLQSVGGMRLAKGHSWRVKPKSQPTVRRDSFSQGGIRLAFDRPMDQESVATALAVSPAIPISLEWEENLLSIQPDEPFVPGNRYLFTLDERATDVAGIPLANKEEWSYRQADVLAGANSDAQSGIVEIEFSYPMERGSVQRSLVIEPEIEAQWAWDQQDTILMLSFQEGLLSEGNYTIGFDSTLRNQDGDQFPPPEPIFFSSSPIILAVSPPVPSSDQIGKARRTQKIHPATPIQVTFDRLMDHETTEAAFEITPALPGEFEWDESTLIFRPEKGYFDEFTRIKVTIKTGATDQQGEAVLAEPYTWSFTTGALSNIASFGSGPNAQVVDQQGRRAIQYHFFHNSRATVGFELYALSQEQFLDRYASGFRGVAGREDRPVSTEDTTLVKQWRTDLEPQEYLNVQEALIPDDVPAGLYILNLTAGSINDQLIVLLTRNVITLKQAEGQIVAWVTDINGGSVADVEVAVYARDGELISEGRADGNGIYRTEVTRNPQPLIVLARDGDDITATGLSNEWRSHGGQSVSWWGTAPTAQTYAAYIYTDRPIYRPGQSVFFKGLLRSDNDAVLSLPPAETPVTVYIRDARDNVVQAFDLTTNPFGTINGEFQLGDGAMLGEYEVEIVLNEEESHRQLFKVEDYRKPDLEVSVTTDAQKYVVGDTINVTVDSRYFFGEPVPNAELKIKQYKLGPRYNRFGIDENNPYIWYDSNEPERYGLSDANGQYAFTVETDPDNFSSSSYWGSSLRRTTYGIEVTVNDGSNQTVSNFAVVNVYNAAENVSVSHGSYFKTPGQPFTIEAEVTTLADEPVSDRALRLDLLRYDLGTFDFTTVVQSDNLTTGADGKAELSFTPQEPGYYRLRLSGTDRLGNEIGYESQLYIFDDASRWHIQDNEVLNIKAEQERYAPGDTARLLVESAFSGPALLTFERGTIRREQPVELTAPLTILEVPIQSDDAPNIFVSVNAWQEQDTTLTEESRTNQPESSLYVATVELQVPVTDKTLNVTITPDKERYAPREEASFAIRVTNEAGQPVSAELSLALVDEAIFSLSEELSGPILDGFYFKRQNIIRTYDSMALLRYFVGLGGPGGGGGGGGGPLGGNPRSEFPDTAAWVPVIETDANGEATFSLTLPDNLTTWRLTAKALTAQDAPQVGETDINFLTQQEIVVRPILPRSLTAGDELALSAIVHNYSDEQKEIEVSLVVSPSSSLEISSPLTQTITLDAAEQRIVGWSATTVEVGEVRLDVRADAGEIGDAVRLTLPVRPLAIPQVESQIGEFSGQFATTLTLPDDALDLSSVKIELSRSIAGSLLNGLEYLTGYPYGCVEQTMSRALPNAVVARTFHQLGISNPTLQADLPTRINAGLQRLYGYQHNDGGWGWWYDDSSDHYQTAWVMFGLAATAEAGYDVELAVIDRGADWLKAELANTTPSETMDPRTRAYVLYSLAMAGQGDLQATRTVAKEINSLDTFSQAALALALHKLGAVNEAQEMLDLLADTAIVKKELVFWPNENQDGYYYQKTMASTTRTTALALSAFVQIDPEHHLIPGIVRWLMEERRAVGWGSTNETSFAILALTDHLLTSGVTSANTPYRIKLNGEEVASGTVGQGELVTTIEIPASQMKRGDNNLFVEQEDDGRLYLVINQRTYLQESEIQAAGDIPVTRTYLDPQTDQPITSVAPSTLVKVELTVNMPEDAFFIILEDNLPGGLEALNEQLNTTSHEGSAYRGVRHYWQEYGYNNKEVHGDRVSFFISELPQGKRTLTYFARATHSGQFIALPTELYAMYDTTVWGRSASTPFTIEERNLTSNQ